MSVTFEEGVLQDHPFEDVLRNFCVPLSPLPEEAANTSFSLYSSQGAMFSAALDGDNVIGTIFYVPAKENGLILDNSDLMSWLDSKGLTLDAITFPAMVLVDPDYRGRGYMTTMATKVTRLSIANGFSHQITLGYESDSVNQYNNHVGRMVDTGLVFTDGKPIYLRSNEDILDALAS